MAAVAMADGINANLLRRWVRMAEMTPPDRHVEQGAGRDVTSTLAPPQPPSFFVPMRLPQADSQGIRIELRRGAMTMNTTLPSESSAECAAWVRELLR